MYSLKVLIAAKKSWERLSYILDDENATKFESLEDFDKFYSVLIDRLYDKDNEEA